MVSAASADGSPAGCPALLALAVPVNDVIGLLGANDAQCVDRCIRGCKVWVLARAPSKAAFWALTQLQELTHARHPKSLQMVIAAMKLKDTYSLEVK